MGLTERIINGLLEPGDKTTITYDFDDAKNSLKFYGKGSEKFSFLNRFIQFGLYKQLKERVTPVRCQILLVGFQSMFFSLYIHI